MRRIYKKAYQDVRKDIEEENDRERFNDSGLKGRKPEDFEERVKQAFREYTDETAKDYRDCDRLGFIDCCVRHINGDKYSYDVVNEKVKSFISSQWEEYGQLDNKDDVYSVDFMADCYAEGVQNTVLCSHFGSDDHHIYDQIQKVLVKVITIVMNYEEVK